MVSSRGVHGEGEGVTGVEVELFQREEGEVVFCALSIRTFENSEWFLCMRDCKVQQERGEILVSSGSLYHDTRASFFSSSIHPGFLFS